MILWIVSLSSHFMLLKVPKWSIIKYLLKKIDSVNCWAFNFVIEHIIWDNTTVAFLFDPPPE